MSSIRSSISTENVMTKIEEIETISARIKNEIEFESEEIFESSVVEIPANTLTCGILEMDYQNKKKVYKLKCIYCECEFILPLWEYFIQHIENLHQSSYTQDESMEMRNDERKTIGAIDDDAEETTRDDENKNGIFLEGEYSEGLKCEMKKNKTKKDKNKENQKSKDKEKLMSLGNAHRCKRYREKLKETPKRDVSMKKAAYRAKKYRQKKKDAEKEMTPEQLQLQIKTRREVVRERVKRWREKKQRKADTQEEVDPLNMYSQLVMKSPNGGERKPDPIMETNPFREDVVGRNLN